jgi:hypothetical protein
MNFFLQINFKIRISCQCLLKQIVWLKTQASSYKFIKIFVSLNECLAFVFASVRQLIV